MQHSEAREGSAGAGPYRIDHDPSDGFFYVWGPEGRGRGYPLGKTALRAARQLNEAHVPTDPHGADAPASRIPNPRKVGKRYPASGPVDPVAKVKTRKAGLPPVLAAPYVPDVALVMFTGTREEWLNAFVAACRPVFAKLEVPIPEKVRVSVGFTSARKAIGQCWSDKASGDGTFEIFVVPTYDDSSRIADIVTHELVHAAVGLEAKHGPKFKALATKLGLEGKMTATTAGDGWREWATPILDKLGPIPHAALDKANSGIKKQGTRLLKGECGVCGFTVRLTAKWVNQASGELRCPDSDCDGALEVTMGGA